MKPPGAYFHFLLIFLLHKMSTLATPRIIRAPRGNELNCKNWVAEAAFRMIQNNLDPEVAERPEDLVVYGGIGKAARDWKSFEKILECLKNLEEDETLMVQSGKPVGVLRSHKNAPRVLIANSNLVGRWANWETFRELEAKGLMILEIFLSRISKGFPKMCEAGYSPYWTRQKKWLTILMKQVQ